MKKIISVYVDQEAVERIDKVARELHRSRGFLVNSIFSAIPETTLKRYVIKAQKTKEVNYCDDLGTARSISEAQTRGR